MFRKCPKIRKYFERECESKHNIFSFFERNKINPLPEKIPAAKSTSPCSASPEDVKGLLQAFVPSVSSKSKTDNALVLCDSANDHSSFSVSLARRLNLGPKRLMFRTSTKISIFRNTKTSSL